MKTDIDGQVAIQREALAQLERELKDLEGQRRVLQQNLKRCEQEIVQQKRACSDLKMQLQRAQDVVERLQGEYDQVNVEDGRLDALKDQLREAQHDVTIYEEAYGSQALEKDKLNEVATARKRELNEVKARVAEHAGILHKAQMKVRNKRQARQISLTEKNIAIEAITKVGSRKQIAEQKRDQIAAKVREFIAQASEVSARVPVPEGETGASLEAKCQQLKATLSAYTKQQGGTDEEINNAYHEAVNTYQTASSYLQSMTELSELLKQSFMQRMKMYRRFQRYISARSRINFNYLLSERAFRGKLLIDHKAKLLDVHVEPDETTKSSKGRATKTLSGGEKSFSSICLLLALWEAMGAPLRCLDEFDVFMDDVNRDVSTRMIVRSPWRTQVYANISQISAARRSTGRQFILITPKALGAGVEIGADVKIHKLVCNIRISSALLLTFFRLIDPRARGQRAIDDMMEAS
jgi:chromosome segregation ATPase